MKGGMETSGGKQTIFLSIELSKTFTSMMTPKEIERGSLKEQNP